MNTPPLPNQTDPCADPDGLFGHIPKSLNPWRSGLAYAALGCTTVGLAFFDVPFIGFMGMMLALTGMILAGKVQTIAMTEPREANPPVRNWLNTFAWIGVFALVAIGFNAVVSQSSAMLAASRGKPIETGGTIPGLIVLSLGVSIVLAGLASASRKADTLQTVPLMLYWMCYVPLATLLVSHMGDGHGFGN